jgi:hypothetical protein
MSKIKNPDQVTRDWRRGQRKAFLKRRGGLAKDPVWDFYENFFCWWYSLKYRIF